MSAPPLWPLEPSWTYTHDYDDQEQPEAPAEQEMPGHGPVHVAIGEMAGLLGETRANMAMNGALLSAVAVGIALEAAFSTRALRAGLPGAVSVGLLFGLVCCWLTAVALLASAGRPVLNSLSELRWGTGAPADPRAGWLTLPALGTDRDQWTWSRAHLLLGAARLARYRIQLADTWTYVTVACFLVWTTASILGL